MSELSLLRAEISRLRALCEDNGIDPDPREPEPEQFGPPTDMMWRLSRLFAKSAEYAAKELMERNELAEFLDGHQWPDAPLRVRVPTNFGRIA